MGSAGGRFFAWVIGGAVPAALGADWLTSAWNQNAALYACAPAAAVAEEVTGTWLKQLFGLPPTASFALVTGCQMAHLTCLAAARHSVLARCGWDVERQGLFGAPRIKLLTSAERHGSLQRAVRILGLGNENLCDLPSDKNGRLSPEALESALNESRGTPCMVVLQAGDLNIGAFDDFAALVPLAHRYGAWVHVDGAVGLWVSASPEFRPCVTGVENADSWATDGHKWLNVPYDCGYAFVAHAEAHRASMSHREAYLTHNEDARDQIDWNPEWSRRARAFPTYAAIRQLGRDGIARLIERCCRLAGQLVDGVAEIPGVEVLWRPTINQGLVTFRALEGGVDETAYVDSVISEVNATGCAFFSGTTWRGRRAMRVSVSNWSTTEQDVQAAISATEKVLSRRKTVLPVSS